MNQSLTVVLPIHNAEATLQHSVEHVLEVAGELTKRVEVLIVDDGSTDDSFDIAREIATRYPQVRVVRQPRRRGLGPTLQEVRRRVKSDILMVHDGVSTTNAEQLRALWNRRLQSPASDVSIADLLRPAQNQAAMEAAHARLSGFLLMTAEEPGGTTGSARTETPPSAPKPVDDGSGMGTIPTLPRPNFLGSVGDFALGE